MLRTALGLWIALIVLPSESWAQTAAAAEPAGRPDVGRTLMHSGDQRCDRCHGAEGQGAYGPALAGTSLSFAQFTRIVRQPIGVMPWFAESQISNQQLADILAYFKSLPAVAKQGPWRQEVPAGAPPAQRAYIDTAMCGQCHGPESVGQPRHLAGGAGADWEWFKRTIYDHSTVWPNGHMPNYSRDKLPEPVLRQIWNYLSVDLGLLADVRASADAGAPSQGGSVTYTVTVRNFGVANKGLTAEGLTVSVAIPADASIVTATNTGYEGVRPDAQTGISMARWTIPSLRAADVRTFTVTLSGQGASAGITKGSTVTWAKPAVREGFPNTKTSDDSVNITLARGAESN